MAQITAHVVLVPSPGMGHLIPFMEFAKRLVQFHKLEITCIIPTIGPPSNSMKAALEALPSTINHIFLPPVSLEDVSEEDTDVTTLIALSMTRSLPSLRGVLKPLLGCTNTVALVVDLFGTDTFVVAKEFNLPTYLLYTTNAMVLSFSLCLQKLDKMVSCEYRDLPEPVKIPGCIPVHGRDFVETVDNRKSDVYRFFLEITKRFRLFKGILINTFVDMEEGAMKALLEDESGVPPVYPIGPLIKSGSARSECECLTWLDQQPSGSVLFVSFGSGGTLSHAQLNELALGLEMSEQRFLWVVRSPNDASAGSAYFNHESRKNPFDYLPNGFIERTRGRGFVISSWAPQVQVLSHGSTAGFLSHCGWNSTLESVVNGVPLIAWPLYAEQKMNAVLLTEDARVALRPRVGEDGLVDREEVCRVVKELMEGENGKRIRRRVKDLKDASSRVLMEDGSSTKALSKLAHEWKNQIFN